MPTPANGYRLKNGERVPGTTTIIGRFKESGALLRWAWKQGRDGKELYDERDRAAEIGTVAHAMVEASIKGQNPEAVFMELRLDPQSRERARDAFRAYQSWAEQSRLQIIEQEMQLVSETYRYGGTPDAIGLLGNALCLLDWKSSSGVYGDYLIQLAAYKNLWEENNPDRPLTGGFHLCRFSKTHGDFEHRFFPNLDNAWRMFILLREAYEIDKELKARTR